MKFGKVVAMRDGMRLRAADYEETTKRDGKNTIIIPLCQIGRVK